MKKLVLLLICLTTLLTTGCDKYAKEKEAMSKAEKTVLSMDVPEVVRPNYSKTPRPTKQDYDNYYANLKKLIGIEEKILEECRKSDAKLAELEQKAESDSDKKNLMEFKEKLRNDRLAFVKKVSKGRLYGDTFIVGVGSTWQEVEMVYGKPRGDGKERGGFKEYVYDGIVFDDWIGGGAYPANSPKLLKWRSTEVQAVVVTGQDIISDVGIKLGMPRDEVLKILKSKYVKKESRQKEEMYLSKGFSKEYFDIVVMYSTQNTLPYNIFPIFKDGKLAIYTISPH